MAGEGEFWLQFEWDNQTPALVMDDYRYSSQQTVNSGTTQTATQGPVTQSQYHTFNCGKCHNPHASRLPKLMITNCLDTQQNTWDDGYQAVTFGNAAGTPWDNTRLSQWPSAQNCHRLADDHATTSRGAGWNVVTPW
jgi:predicted CXXCH cytochrome family protein